MRLALFALALALPSICTAQDLLEPQEAFQVSSVERTGNLITVVWSVAPGYAVFRDRIRVLSSTGIVPSAAERGRMLPDGLGGVAEEFVDDFSMQLQSPAGGERHVDVVVQGCHQDVPQVCFNPTRFRVDIPTVDGFGTPSDGAIDSRAPISRRESAS